MQPGESEDTVEAAELLPARKKTTLLSQGSAFAIVEEATKPLVWSYAGGFCNLGEAQGLCGSCRTFICKLISLSLSLSLSVYVCVCVCVCVSLCKYIVVQGKCRFLSGKVGKAFQPCVWSYE